MANASVISSKSLFYFRNHDCNEPRRLLYPPNRKLSSNPSCCNLYSQKEHEGKRWREKKKIQPSTSFPRGIPLPRAQVRPMTLATNVLKVRYSFRTTPLSIVFISGIPEPGKWKERDGRWDDGVERKDKLKGSNCREKGMSRINDERGGMGEVEKLINIHIQ